MGLLLLAVWLILTGLGAFVPNIASHTGPALPVLAIVAGILILVGR